MSVHTANLRTASRVVGRAVGESSARRTLAISSRVLAQSKEESHQQQPPTPATSRLAPLSPSAPPRKQHSALTIALVKGVARLMGYNSVTTTAIRVTSDLFDRCAERADLESDFWYGGASPLSSPRCCTPTLTPIPRRVPASPHLPGLVPNHSPAYPSPPHPLSRPAHSKEGVGILARDHQPLFH